MITYSVDGFGVSFIFQYHGSVFPKALCWAIPNSALAAVLHHYFHEENEDRQATGGVSILWSGYTFVLGFLIVFLTNQAYSRFWEGATLINQVRGTWFNAVSNMVAFCSHREDRHEDVDRFQHTIVRLASMLYCSALQQICDLPDDTLEIIEVDSFDKESLDYLQGVNDRCEILLQWVQRLVVEATSENVISVAPPIISRVFQELSNGIVDLNNVRKIKEIPFPFPYAQLMTWLLLIHFGVTPVIASQAIASKAWASVMCFFVTSSLWSLLYIAHQIDQPFGNDDNDLPIDAMQRDFNRSLLQLLEPLAQRPPHYHHTKKPSESAVAPLLVASTAGLETTVAPTRSIRRPSLLGDLLGIGPTPALSPRGSYSYGNADEAKKLRDEIQRRVSQLDTGERKSSDDPKLLTIPLHHVGELSESDDESSSDSGSSKSQPIPHLKADPICVAVSSKAGTNVEDARQDATRVTSNGTSAWEPLPPSREVPNPPSVVESEVLEHSEVITPPSPTQAKLPSEDTVRCFGEKRTSGPRMDVKPSLN